MDRGARCRGGPPPGAVRCATDVLRDSPAAFLPRTKRHVTPRHVAPATEISTRIGDVGEL